MVVIVWLVYSAEDRYYRERHGLNWSKLTNSYLCFLHGKMDMWATTSRVFNLAAGKKRERESEKKDPVACTITHIKCRTPYPSTSSTFWPTPFTILPNYAPPQPEQWAKYVGESSRLMTCCLSCLQGVDDALNIEKTNAPTLFLVNPTPLPYYNSHVVKVVNQIIEGSKFLSFFERCWTKRVDWFLGKTQILD